MGRPLAAFGLAALLIALVGCSVFGRDDTATPAPGGDAGSSDAASGGTSGAPGADGGAAASSVVYKGGRVYEQVLPPEMRAEVALPSGLATGDLVWAVVAFRGSDISVGYRRPDGWSEPHTLVSPCEPSDADHTVHHFVRFVDEKLGATAVLADGSSTIDVSIAIAAFSGVDPTQVIESKIVDVVPPGPLVSPSIDVKKPGGRLLLVFTSLNGWGGSWLPVADLTLRESSGEVGIYDAPAPIGIASPRTGASTLPGICGATALAAVLPARP